MNYWFLSIGMGYLFFAILKYKADKTAGRSIDKARLYIILGSLLIIFGIGMTIAMYNGYLD